MTPAYIQGPACIQGNTVFKFFNSASRSLSDHCQKSAMYAVYDAAVFIEILMTGFQ